MWTEYRNWKWMVPALLIAPCLVLWEKAVEWGWGDWSVTFLAAAVIFLIAMLVNGWVYVAHHWADVFSDIQSAQNATPEVRMFEAAKGMHPDAVNWLLLHRRSIWRIKYVPLKDVVDWIFDELPTVHAGFVDFVLDHSSFTSVMSKGLLSDGSKQFDPEELVADRQQYDELITYMQMKLMCTKASGSSAPKWLPPWNPELVRHRFGLDGAPYAVEEDGITESMRAVIRAQAKSKNNGNNGANSAQRPEFIEKALEDLQTTTSANPN